LHLLEFIKERKKKVIYVYAVMFGICSLVWSNVASYRCGEKRKDSSFVLRKALKAIALAALWPVTAVLFSGLGYFHNEK
jgi:hypothetical protein